MSENSKVSFGFPQLGPGQLHLVPLNGPPATFTSEAVSYTHKVFGVPGHPYYVFCRLVKDDTGKLTAIRFHNPDTSRDNIYKGKK